MKKVIVVLLCMAGMTGMAQKEERHNGERHQEKKHRSTAASELSPEQLATLKTKKMVLALDLNEVQQKELQALNFENTKIRKTERDERQAKIESGEFKRPTADERYAIQNERLDRMIAQRTEMKEILSQEQYDQWMKMEQRKTRYRKGMHHKREKSDRDTGKK
ncbi:MAG: hypothetical protein WA913_16370 [Pricia sp.]